MLRDPAQDIAFEKVVVDVVFTASRVLGPVGAICRLAPAVLADHRHGSALSPSSWARYVAGTEWIFDG